MGTNVRLSTMMFLEYFIWSAWYVTLGTWLGIGLHFDGKSIGLIAGTTAIAASLSPLFLGAMADRFIAAHKMLAALHLMGGILLLFAARQHSVGTIYIVLLAYSICYMPTLALSNTICFRHLGNAQERFSSIRVLGTLGWIAAGILVGSARISNSNSSSPDCLLFVCNGCIRAHPAGHAADRTSQESEIERILSPECSTNAEK